MSSGLALAAAFAWPLVVTVVVSSGQSPDAECSTPEAARGHAAELESSAIKTDRMHVAPAHVSRADSNQPARNLNPVEHGFFYPCYFECQYPGNCFYDDYIYIEDTRRFAPLMTGPTVAGDEQCCCCADLNGDERVALDDYAIALNWDLRFPITPYRMSLAIVSLSGFCPQVGDVYVSSVYRGRDGSSWLVGSRVQNGDPEVDDCLLFSFSQPSDCPVIRSFAPKRLTSTEVTTINQLLLSISQAPPDDSGIDVEPCVIVVVRSAYGCFDDYGVDHTPLREAVQAVYGYIDS